MRARNCGVSLLGLLVAKTVIGRLSRGRNNGVRLHSASRAVPGGAGVEVSKADGAVDQRAQSEHSNSNRRPRIGSGSRGLILLLQGGALLLVLQLLVLGSFSIWWSARQPVEGQPVEGQPFAGQPYLQLLTTFTGVAMVLWSMVALSVVWNVLEFGAGSAASLSRSSGVAHMEPPQRPGPQGVPAPFVDLSGRWVKDRAASSSMEDALSAMQLGGLVRTAVKLVRGLEIHHTREHFHYGVFSAIPILKIWERYQLNGEPARFKRRDLRRGKHVGSCEPHDTGVVVKVRWDEPLGGHGEDVFRLISPTELHVLSHLILDNRPDRTVRFTAVYRKR